MKTIMQIRFFSYFANVALQSKGELQFFTSAASLLCGDSEGINYYNSCLQGGMLAVLYSQVDRKPSDNICTLDAAVSLVRSTTLVLTGCSCLQGGMLAVLYSQVYSLLACCVVHVSNRRSPAYSMPQFF